MHAKTNDGNANQNGGVISLKNITLVFLAIQLIMTISISAYMFITNLFPAKYILLIGGVFFIVWFLQLFFLFRSKTLVKAKQIFSVFISLVCITGIVAVLWNLGALMNTIGGISVSNTTKEEVNIYTVRVLTGSPLQSINDLSGKKLGVSATYGENDIEFCKNSIKDAMGTEPSIKNYDDIESLTKGLTDRTADAILFDESATGMIDEYDADFIDSTRVIYEIKVPVSKDNTQREKVNMKSDSFNVLITGIDTRTNKITSRGNSDVNIIVTVNPKKKKILLTSTPRDYYVPLNGDTSKMDKLTHAGCYGPEASMKTLSVLYDTPIDLYIKTNFVSVERMIDAFGGVTVESEVSFTGKLRNGQPVHFSKGTNKLDGDAALAYARERKAIASGDRGRGRHQQQIITALIKKATSSAMLTKYGDVLDIIQSNTVTNLSTEEMTDFIKMQLSSPGEWEIESIDVDGTGQRSMTYSYRSHSVYVMVPNQTTVNNAKEKIKSYLE